MSSVRGNDTVVNVLDDILDANTGDDDLIVEMASEGKIEHAMLAKQKSISSNKIAKVKPSLSKGKATTTKPGVSVGLSVKQDLKVKEPRSRVQTKSVEEKDLKPSKGIKKMVPRKEVKKVLKKPEKAHKEMLQLRDNDGLDDLDDDYTLDLDKDAEDELLMNKIDDHYEDDSDDKHNVSISAEESEDLPAAGNDAMVIQDYDTRSEIGTSSSETSLTDSNSESYPSDKEKKDEPRREKNHKRGISPIEWDRKSEDSADEDDDGDDSESERRRSASRLKYLFKRARFFLIKSNNHENVALAKAKGVWSTPPQNEARLNQAFREADNVILVFSVKESGKFQGFARLSAESTRDHPPIRWVLPPGLSARALSGVFKLDWINRRDLQFTKTTHLHNPWNENKYVKIGRDGQEIEPTVGEALCKLFPSDDNVDLGSIVRKARKSHHHSRSSERHLDRYRGVSSTGGPSGPGVAGTASTGASSSSGPRNSEISRRRRHREEFESPRVKRSRMDYDNRNNLDAYYKERRPDRPPRYGGVRRETFLNGSYSDYMREFQHVRPPPPPMSPYGPPPPAYGHHMDPMVTYTGHYDNRPRNYMTPPEYGPASISNPRRTDKRSASAVWAEKRSYERDVDDFLRRTTHGNSSRDRHRHRDRR
ncbi:YTH domain-containing protein 1 isoform X3 [Octopus sinensis]|uniref:YTH domain-containing protein 1 isoform X3 n=1 Tax=Octopus sinensis TaxID=2607531 RepID=A0A6P7SQX4_9MOLL|nr:YTH domain-containing protein 1 isoform X3 [Octopus sinensis]